MASSQNCGKHTETTPEGTDLLNIVRRQRDRIGSSNCVGLYRVLYILVLNGLEKLAVQQVSPIRTE